MKTQMILDLPSEWEFHVCLHQSKTHPDIASCIRAGIDSQTNQTMRLKPHINKPRAVLSLCDQKIMYQLRHWMCIPTGTLNSVNRHITYYLSLLPLKSSSRSTTHEQKRFNISLILLSINITHTLHYSTTTTTIMIDFHLIRCYPFCTCQKVETD